MQTREKIFLLSIALAILLHLFGGFQNGKNLGSLSNLISGNPSQKSRQNPDKNDPNLAQNTFECPTIESIRFIRTDNKGHENEQGINYVLIFDPKSKDLDFKVNLGVSHKLYDKDDNEKILQKYVPKLFGELVYNSNSNLDGKRPIAAINGDFVDTNNKPQGLNISRGIEYSGAFKNKRSSFGISGGKPEERIATIQVGRRKEEILNYNVVGGNGRFYQNGKFKDICTDLGDACGQNPSRSIVAITAKGYVVFLVNSAGLKKALYPSMLNRVLRGIAARNCLGMVREGMLLSGGFYTGFYYDNKIYVANPHPIGSVFLIYKK
jgi:hypothetical protein